MSGSATRWDDSRVGNSRHTSLKPPNEPVRPEPRQATAEEASILGVQKAALVAVIRRTYHSDEGRPVETADIVVPAAHRQIVYGIPLNR